MGRGDEGRPGPATPTRVLPRVVPAPPGKPHRPGAAETRARALRIARDPASWGRDEAIATRSRFDVLAESWDGERAGYRPAPLADALARGGPWPDGLCVEIGSGTGVLTPLLLERWPATVGVDLSPGMLARARTRLRVRADASKLPLSPGLAAAVVVGDAPLFATEVDRALRPGGVVLWVNALGPDAPYWVPVEELRAALGRASGIPWSAVASEALWGSWAVLRREPENR